MSRILDLSSFLVGSAVRIGKVIVPANSVEETLHRYVKALVHLNKSVDHPYSIRGSMTALKFKDRYFSFFCKHQIAGVSAGDLGWLPRAAHGAFYIGGGTFHDVRPDISNEDEEFVDICAVEIDPQKFGITNLNYEFFDINPNDCWPSNSLGNLIIFGLPFSLQNVKISEEDGRMQGINFRTVVVGGRYIRNSYAQSVHQAEMTRTKDFAPDGMSGGPVFHLGKDSHGYFVGLAGIVMRGGAFSDNFHFIDSGFLHQFWETEQSTA